MAIMTSSKSTNSDKAKRAASWLLGMRGLTLLIMMLLLLSAAGSTETVEAANDDESPESSSQVCDNPETCENGDSDSGSFVVPPSGESFRLVQVGKPIVSALSSSIHDFAISNNAKRVAVGAHYDGPAGEYTGLVQIFEKQQDGESYSQIGSNIYGDNSQDRAGVAVSLSEDGDWLAVGAPNIALPRHPPGYVKLLHFEDGEWKQKGDNVMGRYPGEGFGSTVSLCGNGSKVSIGGSHFIRMYQYDNSLNLNKWDQMGADFQAKRMTQVSMSDKGSQTIVAVSTPFSKVKHDGDGRVQVFAYNENTNKYDQLGQNLDGKADLENFGYSISISGNGHTLVSGTAFGNYAKVLHYDSKSNNWTRKRKFEGTQHEDQMYGYSVDISKDGNRLVVSSPRFSDHLQYRGRVQLYAFDGLKWNQLHDDLLGEQPLDHFGHDVKISPDGEYVAVLAQNPSSSKSVGKIYMFQVVADDQSSVLKEA